MVGVVLALLAAGCRDAGPGGGGQAEGSARRWPVVFLTNSTVSALSAEENAALDWIRSANDFEVRVVQFADVADGRITPADIVWWHYAQAPELPSVAMRPESVAALREHVDRGGHLLLTLLAASYVLPLGLESVAPDQVAIVPGTDFLRWPLADPEDGGEERILAGLQSYRGHPLLRRFWGGTYTASIDPRRSYPVSRYTGDNWPAEGAVIAVGKRTIGIDSDHKVVLEYRPSSERPGGRVLTIGEALYFAGDNHNRTQLELLATDALTYLGGKLPPAPLGAAIPSTGAPTLPSAVTMAGDEATAPAPPRTDPRLPADEPDGSDLPEVLAATTYWAPGDTRVRVFEPVATADPELPDPGGLLEAVSAARSGLALETEAEAATPFDLSSPRVLVTGRQNGRIEDLWVYPLRILRNLRFGLVRNNEPVEWFDALDGPIDFIARPEGHTFRSRGDPEVTLHLAVPRDNGGLLALLEVHTSIPLRVIAAWETDHAPMWPRGSRYLGGLQLGWDSGAQAIVWRDPTARFVAYAGFGREPTRVLLGFDRDQDLRTTGRQTTVPQIDLTAAGVRTRRVAIEVPFDPATDSVLTFAVGGGRQDAAASRQVYADMLADPIAVWTANANYYRQLIADTLDLATPDPTFNEAFRWAKVGLDAFRVTTPGMGTGLSAGYASSAVPQPGSWATENDFLRRPGYGWYFGRDAVWTGFAADAYGGTDLTSEALRFLARYQDVDGKILHEMSPAWSIHYDAADSTPLFLLGLHHHVRATGDRELLRTLWPSVRRAMAFLESTDTDGDGWIENTDVGHGWIEGGRFYGAHTTFYLASLWAATLEAVESMATWMADTELAASTHARVQATREMLNTEFWDDQRRTYHYGKKADGTFLPIQTIMPAVPMVFGLLEELKVRPLLEKFASAEITADWGTRMTETTNPDYDPSGYHDGMVWPLFSGWAALAAYRYHRPLGATIPLNATLRLYRHGNLGRVPETLHGDRFELMGVTSHQAWSQAMAILPAVEGLLGVRPDALQGRLRIHPHLPGGWDEVVAQPVRVGDDAFRIKIIRETETTRFVIDRLAGANPIELELSLPFPRSVLVNLDRDATTGAAIPEGEEIIDHPSEKEALVRATLTGPSATVTFRHSPYPQVVQTMPTLQPGAPSTGLRILETRYAGGSLVVRLQGIPGRLYRLTLATPWPVATVEGGVTRTRVVSAGPGRASIELTIPGTGDNYQRADISVQFQHAR